MYSLIFQAKICELKSPFFILRLYANANANANWLGTANYKILIQKALVMTEICTCKDAIECRPWAMAYFQILIPFWEIKIGLFCQFLNYNVKDPYLGKKN